MREKYRIPTITFTLQNLISDLGGIIIKEQLFDPLNPDIILCDSDLEVALNLKALRVTDLKHYILSQLVCIVPYQTSFKNPYYAIETRSDRNRRYFNKLEIQFKQMDQQMSQRVFKKAESYKLKPLLKKNEP